MIVCDDNNNPLKVGNKFVCDGEVPKRIGTSVIEQAVYDSQYCVPVYIVLSNPGTILSKAIEFAVGDKFTHAAISFNSKLDPMYTFGVKNLDDERVKQLNQKKIGWKKKLGLYSKIKSKTGLSMDTVNIMRYSKSTPVYYEVFVMFISKNEYDIMRERLQGFIDNTQTQSFHLAGVLFFAWFNIPFEYGNDYFCSRFVATLLATIRNLDMQPSQYRPQDLAYLPYTSLVNKGEDITKYDYRVTDKAVKELIERGGIQNATEYVKSFIK